MAQTPRSDMGNATHGVTAAVRAAGVLRNSLGASQPAVTIVLGSGLGGLAHRVGDARSVDFADVPGFPVTSVSGHAGKVITGSLGGRHVLLLAGRFHMYEGHGAAVAGFPVRVAHALGARILFVSNAAGGVRRTFRPGDLMLIRDHINLMWRNPLFGPVEPGDLRFPDMTDPYDLELSAGLRSAAIALGTPLVEGVYCGLSGPAYETPAEVRMLERLGADAVGMSTVPETLVARALGIRVAGISCITNPAAGLALAPLDHAEVLETTTRVAVRFEQLVERWVSELPHPTQH